MDETVWKEYLNDNRALESCPPRIIVFLFVDNSSSHVVDNEYEEALNARRTSIRKFPANVSHLIQPADSFVIPKIKQEWV